MYKFIRSIKHYTVFLFMFSLFSSGYAENLYKKPPAFFDRKVKKILILPVYANRDDLIPNMVDATEAEKSILSYPDEYKQIIDKITGKTYHINEILKRGFSHGEYNFEVIESETTPEVVKEILPFYKGIGFSSKDFEWKFDIGYTLSPETVKSLVEEYNADAIFFHYVSRQKRWDYSITKVSKYGNSTSISYSYLGMDSLMYVPQVYYKDGTLIFGGHEATYIKSGTTRLYQMKGRTPLLNMQRRNADFLAPVQLDSALSEIDVMDRKYFFKKLVDDNRDILHSLIYGI